MLLAVCVYTHTCARQGQRPRRGSRGAAADARGSCDAFSFSSFWVKRRFDRVVFSPPWSTAVQVKPRKAMKKLYWNLGCNVGTGVQQFNFQEEL